MYFGPSRCGVVVARRYRGLLESEDGTKRFAGLHNSARGRDAVNLEKDGPAQRHEAHEDPCGSEEDGGSYASLDPEPGEKEITDTHARQSPAIFHCAIKFKVHDKMLTTELRLYWDLCLRC